jgi:hypothetical protein
VNPEGGVRPRAGAGVTVEQHHQPGTDVAAEPGGQFAGAAVDPGPDRRSGVVVQQSSRNWKNTVSAAARPVRVDGLALRSTLPK